MTDEPRLKKPRHVSFPWISSLTGLTVASFLLLTSEPQLADYYPLPSGVMHTEIKLGALVLFCLAMLLDIYLYQRRQIGFRNDIARMKKELAQVWQSKKQLQLRVHTYSGHADKLKLFISEKLLDYIEYDEKFLHFKSIASEVRHNGVICFDKVQTALQSAIARDEERHWLEPRHGEEPNPDYRDALSAMRYLWDLLDLSTTDNIALHIGNQLCECEEHYYQLILNGDDPEAAPYQPDYVPRAAALKALAPLLQTSASGLEMLHWETPGSLNLDNDAQFRVHMEPTETLLGNENHFILLLENLLKNAQFFARKKAYRHKYARIALTLDESDGQIRLSVYNRGPHIPEDKTEQIFQLGYSTRRAREHHGKGLGLFFVQEVVKGYEGRIGVENIHNQKACYSLRIALADATVVTEVLEVDSEDDQLVCRRSRSDQWDKTLEWQLQCPIVRVEITSADSQQTLGFDCDPTGSSETILDPENTPVPRWALEIYPQRKAGKLIFMPLDVSGVRFHISLPSAASRLDSAAQDPDNIDAQVEELNRPFEVQNRIIHESVDE